MRQLQIVVKDSEMDDICQTRRREVYEDFPRIVCLCGSTRFMEAFRAANFTETLRGNIVLTVGCDTRSDEGLGLSPDVKAKLDELHKRKIDLADEVFVLNCQGYIGASTRSEIEYAQAKGKPVRFLERMEPEHFFDGQPSSFDYSGQERDLSNSQPFEVPVLLCDLARALPMSCDPSHEPRENPAICKSCDDTRDEIQQLVGDGDLFSIAIAVGVYLRRLYAEHEKVCNFVELLREQAFVPVDFDLYKAIKDGLYETTGVMEMIFGEVLSDDDRDVPTDDKAVRMVKEMIAPVAMGENLTDEEYKQQVDRYSQPDFVPGLPQLQPGDLCECEHALNRHGERGCLALFCKCSAFTKGGIYDRS